MVREQITDNGNCYKYKYYKLDSTYYVDIYRETSQGNIFQTSSNSDNLKRLLQIIDNWELYYQPY